MLEEPEVLLLVKRPVVAGVEQVLEEVVAVTMLQEDQEIALFPEQVLAYLIQILTAISIIVSATIIIRAI